MAKVPQKPASKAAPKPAAKNAALYPSYAELSSAQPTNLFDDDSDMMSFHSGMDELHLPAPFTDPAVQKFIDDAIAANNAKQKEAADAAAAMRQQAINIKLVQEGKIIRETAIEMGLGAYLPKYSSGKITTTHSFWYNKETFELEGAMQCARCLKPIEQICAEGPESLMRCPNPPPPVQKFGGKFRQRE
jgi:hypothetical protein